jgi:hypothetical protein
MSTVRQQRRAIGAEAIRKLAACGFTVTMLTEYQYRINDTIDLYPTRERYHNVITGERGNWGKPLVEFCQRQIDNSHPVAEYRREHAGDVPIPDHIRHLYEPRKKNEGLEER